MVPVGPILFGKLSQRPANVNVVETTEDPQIKSFHSTSFGYHVDEKIEINSWQGNCLCGVCTSPMSASVFSCNSNFLPVDHHI